MVRSALLAVLVLLVRGDRRAAPTHEERALALAASPRTRVVRVEADPGYLRSLRRRGLAPRRAAVRMIVTDGLLAEHRFDRTASRG